MQEDKRPSKITRRQIIFILAMVCVLVLAAAFVVVFRDRDDRQTEQPSEEVQIPETWASPMADGARNEAISLTFNGKPEEALAMLDGHLAKDTLTDIERAWLLMAKGQVLDAMGDHEGNLARYLEAREFAPEMPRLYAGLANIYGLYFNDRVEALKNAKLSVEKYDLWDGKNSYSDDTGNRWYYEDIVKKWQ